MPDSTPEGEWQNLGERIREAREYLGLSQGEVAEVLGVTRPAVSGIESGRRKVSTLELKELSRLLRRPYEYFLGGQSALDPTTQALFNTTQELSADDRSQVLRFAEFLRSGPAPPDDAERPQ